MDAVIKLIVGLIAIPLLILNLFGGIFSGVWLGFSGDWAPLGLGLIFMLLGSFLASILLIPSILVAGIALFFMKKKMALGVAISALISQSYIFAVIFGLSYWVFSLVDLNSSSHNTIILLIWSYVVAVTPWTYMASKEQDSESTMFSLFSAQVGLLAIMILVGTGTSNLGEAFKLISSLAVIPASIAAFNAYKMIYNRGELMISGGAYADGKYTQSDLIAFVVAQVHMSGVDGKSDESELEHIRLKFKEITGDRISKKFVLNVKRVLDNGEVSYHNIIEESRWTVSEEMKQDIIRTAYSLSLTDGVLHTAEKKAISSMAKELGLSHAQTLHLLEDSSSK